uniref:Uncharacterized protein isoform X1 n=2 Tax=Nicotiana TaxID=4085 RepID=A0A1S4BDK9_TOBAC|nr:PREDICTED: uncharacterized protein LOC104227817 isoform X1 [Nicotiana sylvestris]XP_009778454.1 PREDICTED: uncharacterized protein LOC104227817 isoform X1 [Nicotiana sylvestris]XP_016487010.1 PREDICTED: uncharacterized protein LOC107807162 isoform X1 [Nicotiana tabacum]XP_016487078.1 PREDICTED: uncharacterized protein LOC107807162 isoform X1 [Nicotiana tabacum]
MSSRQDSDVDDDFSDLYKEYTGPVRSNTTKAQEITVTNKRSHAGSDEEEDAPDPNAVPTDFTSREAKVWEAKSKATERNWKKRKEEELICKICGESGHFTQGCPSTLGANRKSQDFFERVPARESHVKALFTEKVINQIEKDVGCKIKMEERFIIVSGKDRLILRKGVDAVHKIKEEADKKGPSSSQASRSRSPERRSPVSSRMVRSDSQRSNHSPQNASQLHHRYGRQEKVVDDRGHDGFHKIARGSSQARAYGNDGARGRSSQSKSPARPAYMSNSYNSYDGHGQGRSVYRSDGWDAGRRGSDMKSNSNFDYPSIPQSLENLELDYQKDAIDLGRIRDKEEDEENHKHREAVREVRENYMKKLAILRVEHAKQWEEFLQLDARRRQQLAGQHVSASGFGSYNQQSYQEYENSAGNPHYSVPNVPVEPRGRYPNPMDIYHPSRPEDSYGDFQRQRRDDYGKAYNRY